MEDFCLTYNVSRETYQKFVVYADLLRQWQTKFNLVSQNSLSDLWQRHIADSAQLFAYLPPAAQVLYDLGSGAGFPGLVLAIMAAEKMPQLKLTLIESIGKKTLYLNAVKDALELKNVTIINDRSEHLDLPPADVITARAVTALDRLLVLAQPFCRPDTLLIFPKGQRFQEELTAAEKSWNFKRKICRNNLSPEGVILLLEHIRRKKK